MNTTQKLTSIATALLACIILTTSYSKEQGEKIVKKGKMNPMVVNASDFIAVGDNTLSATRNGQYVTLNWQIIASRGDIKQINIFRSPTGINRIGKVAELKPDATSYTDSLPNDNAHWYWLRLVATDDKVHEIGPVRAPQDPAGSTKYSKPDDKYKVTITRTDDIATLKWNFPKDNYKKILVVRNPRPVAQPFNGNNGHVLTTLEGKAQCNDALPDPNAEYWYWFRIIESSGAFVYLGPIKAEYSASGGK